MPTRGKPSCAASCSKRGTHQDDAGDSKMLINSLTKDIIKINRNWELVSKPVRRKHNKQKQTTTKKVVQLAFKMPHTTVTLGRSVFSADVKLGRNNVTEKPAGSRTGPEMRWKRGRGISIFYPPQPVRPRILCVMVYRSCGSKQKKSHRRAHTHKF